MQFLPNKIIAVAALSLLGLVSCSPPDKMDFRSCPRVVVLGDADKVTRQRTDASQDIADVIYQARLGNIRGGCKYYDDSVDLEFSVDLMADAGAAIDLDKNWQEEYFIAILDAQGNRLTKKNFVADLNFDQATRKAVTTETITPSIPLAEKEDAAGYTVYVGLQLPQAVLDQNRVGKE